MAQRELRVILYFAPSKDGALKGEATLACGHHVVTSLARPLQDALRGQHRPVLRRHCPDCARLNAPGVQPTLLTPPTQRPACVAVDKDGAPCILPSHRASASDPFSWHRSKKGAEWC